MVDATDLLQRARGRSPAEILLTGIGAFILAWVELAIGLADAIVGIIRDPLGAMGSGAAFIIDALLGGAGRIIFQAALTTQQALLPGQPWAVGPLTFGIGVGSAGFGLFVMAKFLQLPATSDTLPGTFTDIDPPFLDIGVEEEEDN